MSSKFSFLGLFFIFSILDVKASTLAVLSNPSIFFRLEFWGLVIERTDKPVECGGTVRLMVDKFFFIEISCLFYYKKQME